MSTIYSRKYLTASARFLYCSGFQAATFFQDIQRPVDLYSNNTVRITLGFIPEDNFMALVRCPECNSEISDKASHCVKCGCPISPSDNSSSSIAREPAPDGLTKKQPEPIAVQRNYFSFTKRLISHKYTFRVLMVFIASWIVGCISTKTDPSKIYLIFSYPLGIANIAAQGFGGLIFAFVVAGSLLYIYGKVRKNPPSFYSYLAWSTILSSILLANRDI